MRPAFGPAALLALALTALSTAPDARAGAPLLGFGRSAPKPDEPAAPDPNDWWAHGEPSVAEVKDPLFGRRAGKDELARAPRISSNADGLLYRLWGLQPLQLQVVRRGEVILELWMRPQDNVRQAVIRITLRDDGRGFLQARAGLGCCSPEIGRRVDIDRELEPGWIDRLSKIPDDPAWRQPERVSVDEPGMVEGLCLGGISYDLVLVEHDKAAHLRRACAGPERGSVADVLAAVIGPALGRDQRFDVLFPHGIDFSSDKAAYAQLLAEGGKLIPEKVRPE